jgi:hypothetical protein
MFDFLKTNPNKVLDIADKGVSSVISGIDKLFYTAEEKSQSFQKRLELSDKIAQTHIDLIKATATENSTRSITRRIATFFILGLFSFSLVLSSIGWMVNPEWAMFVMKSLLSISTNPLMLMVAGFFYGSHMLNSYTQGKK